MKNINIAAIIILSIAFISDENNLQETQKVHAPIIVEPGEEVVVDSEELITDNFSRPRKPCPPGGPGRR
jgi:hypothetical protein